MSETEPQTETIYIVVVNDEGQYSIWPSHKPLPDGWRDGGKTASKADCLTYIESVWTDMRPLSLQQAMTLAARPQGT